MAVWVGRGKPTAMLTSGSAYSLNQEAQSPLTVISIGILLTREESTEAANAEVWRLG